MCTTTGLTAKKRLVRAFFWFVATRRSRNRSGNDDFGRNKGLTAHNYNKNRPLVIQIFHFYAHCYTSAHASRCTSELLLKPHSPSNGVHIRARIAANT